VSPDAERIVSLYQRHAARWDELRSAGTLFEKSWLDRFLALVPEGGSILDLGCGAGLPIAGYFIQQKRKVTGIDTSAPLLDLCRRRFPEGQWILADMRSLDLGRIFDGILAWNSFFHLTPEDQREMFGIFARHAAPGAALMFTGGPQHGSVVGDFEGEPLYHGSLDPQEYATLLEEHGFERVASVLEDPTCGQHCIWLARAR
jgi:SAM-dependent methyltransferase